MGLDRVQRDVEPRANLAPRGSRDASQHREAGRAGFLDALRSSACSADRPNAPLAEAEADDARGPVTSFELPPPNRRIVVNHPGEHRPEPAAYELIWVMMS